MIPSDPRAVHTGELPEHPPAGSWVDVEPPTEPDASLECEQWPFPCDCGYCENRRAAEASHDAVPTPRLDPDLMGGACRRTLAAAVHAIVGEPLQALAQAKRARELLDYAISGYERAAFVARMVTDQEPILSGERDTRQAEAG